MPFERTTELTEKQAEVWKYLVDHVERHGFQPSNREMAEHFGIFPKALSDRLDQLASKGYIQFAGKWQDRCLKLNYVRFHAEFTEEP